MNGLGDTERKPLLRRGMELISRVHWRDFKKDPPPAIIKQKGIPILVYRFTGTQ